MQDPGTILEGKYEILGTIRESETGAIYKVRHVHLDEIRILKAMRRQGDPGDEAGRRFFREAKTLTHLRHPNICSILDLFQDAQGTSYIVFEYIDGVNISELLDASVLRACPSPWRSRTRHSSRWNACIEETLFIAILRRTTSCWRWTRTARQTSS